MQEDEKWKQQDQQASLYAGRAKLKKVTWLHNLPKVYKETQSRFVESVNLFGFDIKADQKKVTLFRGCYF